MKTKISRKKIKETLVKKITNGEMSIEPNSEDLKKEFDDLMYQMRLEH